jgi:hypothetical protein
MPHMNVQINHSPKKQEIYSFYKKVTFITQPTCILYSWWDEMRLKRDVASGKNYYEVLVLLSVEEFSFSFHIYSTHTTRVFHLFFVSSLVSCLIRKLFCTASVSSLSTLTKLSNSLCAPMIEIIDFHCVSFSLFSSKTWSL